MSPRGRSGRVRKISPSTGIRSPDRPSRSESLYRLSYPGPQKTNNMEIYTYLIWDGLDLVGIEAGVEHCSVMLVRWKPSCFINILII